MRCKRLWTIFKARNYEFFRDREAFGWNFLFPFLIILGFAVIFKGDYQSGYKVGVFPVAESDSMDQRLANLPSSLTEFEAISWIAFGSGDDGLKKLKHHKIDLLLEADTSPVRYWISDASHKGKILDLIHDLDALL